MGLMQRAYETYDKMEGAYAGIYISGKEPLAPVSHILAFAELEITLDEDGSFVSASSVDKSEGKILIPVTEDSAGRTSSPCAHPLCEQLGYLSGQDEGKYNLYVDGLTAWAESEYSHPKCKAVLHYVKEKTVLSDLLKYDLIKIGKDGKPEKEKALIRWRVYDDNGVSECWKDKTLFASFIQYYQSMQKADNGICMITGKKLRIAKQHTKGIVAIKGNAKLISANDSVGFTYRGRFLDDKEAVSVSYEASQKAHNALRWIIANQAAIYGGRTFICWNPQGVSIPAPTVSVLRSSERWEMSEYKEALRGEILGLKEKLPKNASVVLAVFDAATTGRLALTFYSEYIAEDFLQRIYEWESTCCWQYGGIHSPSLLQIVNYAYGNQRTVKGRTTFVTDDKLMAQQLLRLIASKVDGKTIPRDLMLTLVNRASAPQAYDIRLWRTMVFITCSAIQKYYAQRNGGDLIMNWELTKKDRDFQFGRLLAVLEKIEEEYYRNTEQDRMTNAIKSLSQFRRTPFTVYERIYRMLKTAYLPRLRDSGRRVYFERLIGEITDILKDFDEDTLNAPLSEIYLMGYSLQRNAFFKGKNNDNTDDTAETEE